MAEEGKKKKKRLDQIDKQETTSKCRLSKLPSLDKDYRHGDDQPF